MSSNCSFPALFPMAGSPGILKMKNFQPGRGAAPPRTVPRSGRTALHEYAKRLIKLRRTVRPAGVASGESGSELGCLASPHRRGSSHEPLLLPAAKDGAKSAHFHQKNRMRRLCSTSGFFEESLPGRALILRSRRLLRSQRRPGPQRGRCWPRWPPSWRGRCCWPWLRR